MIQKRHLPDVTLLSFAWGDEKYLKLLLQAYAYFADHFQFGQVTFLVSQNLLRYPGVPPEVTLHPVLQEFDMNKYNYFCVKSLYRYVETDYVMLFQYDGFIVNPNAWRADFLDYDYIGAPWSYNDSENVGNGGFSIRSRKLQTILGTDAAIDPLPMIGSVNEDEYICRKIGKYLREKYHIQFAPEQTAKLFSCETGEYHSDCLAIHGEDAFFKYIIHQRDRKKVAGS